MKNRKRLWRLLPLLLAPLLLTGCWQDSTQGESELLPSETAASQSHTVDTSLPKSFALAYYVDQTLDPVTCADGAQQIVGTLVYEGLFSLDTTLAPQSCLCVSEQCDATGLIWTFTMRSGVTFSDGSPFTAADATATLNRARTSDRYRARLSGISAIAGEGNTLTVTLSAPNAGLPALLDIPIVKSGTETQMVPVGTGPYVYAEDGDGSFLQTNSAWWNGGGQPVERITLMPVTDEDSVRYRFSSHDLQLITADLTGSDPVSVTGDVAFQDADTTVLQYIGFNTRREPFSDAAVRSALSLGIDRESAVSAFLSGHGRAAQFPVSPVSAEYPADLESEYSYNDFAAAMEAAGLSGGKSRTVTLLVNEENSFKVSMATSIASALSAFDLQVEVKTLPWAEYAAALDAGNFDLYYGEIRLTADWNLRPLIGTGGSLNYGGFSDATMDLLLDEYAAAKNRPAAMESLCRYLCQQAPLVPVCFKSISVLSQSGVIGNLTPTAANPFFDLPTCTFHLAG